MGSEMCIRDSHYLQRRRLTEAARFLCHTKRTIAEIALSVGYESQQAFTAIFKKLYKHNRRSTFGKTERFILCNYPVFYTKRPLKRNAGKLIQPLRPIIKTGCNFCRKWSADFPACNKLLIKSLCKKLSDKNRRFCSTMTDK